MCAQPVAVHRVPARNVGGFPGDSAGVRLLHVRRGDQRARRAGRRPTLVRRHPVAAGGGGRGVVGARLRRAVERGARTAGAPRGRRRKRHLVHLGGRQPVGRHRFRKPGGGVRRGPPATVGAGHPLLVGGGVPVRRIRRLRVPASDAVPAATGGSRPAVLGFHGRPGDHRRRRRPDRRDGQRADGRRDPGADCRPVGRILGLRDLADPGARRRRMVAARSSPGTTALRGHALEHHLPARHVRGRQHLPRPGRPAAAGRGDRHSLALAGPRGLGDRVRRHGAARGDCPVRARGRHPRSGRLSQACRANHQP